MVSLYLILPWLPLIQLTTSIHLKSSAELPSLFFHLKLPKRPRHKAALRGSSLSSTSSSIPTPPTPPLQQQQQQSRGRSKQASPRPVTRENEGNRGISAKDIYDAVRSGKSAMVVSKPSAEEQKGEGVIEINTCRDVL